MTDAARWATSAVLAATLVLVGALIFGGGSPQPVPEGIPDPGALTIWALPAFNLAADVAGFMTIGFLLSAVFLMPSTGETVRGLSSQGVRWAGRTALCWAVFTVGTYLFTVSDVFAVGIADVFSWPLLSGLASDTTLGRGILAQIAFAAVVAVVARWTISIKGLALVLGLSLAGLAPVALTGHAASAGSHSLATVSLLLHLVGAALWVGGLGALCWVAWRGSKRLDVAINRYSVLALWCFGLVGISGVVNAAVRLGDLSALITTSYGVLVIGKAVALVVLGAFGFGQRQRIIASSGSFLRLCATELFVMGMAIALAVALSRTPTPVPDDLLRRPVDELLGGPMPAAPTVMRILWGWSPNGVGVAIVGVLGALYACGLRSLRKRETAWPISRTISWYAGLLIIAWATFGGLGVYAHVLFSAHMVSHMMLSMVAPILLILAAPMTLALRTLPGPRQPGELAPRQLLIAFLHSRFSRFVTHPLVGPSLFVASLYGLYFTDAFGALMSSHLGHSVMELHFLAVGTLYYYVLVGIDPSPRNLPSLVRFGILLVTVPFHAFFAVSVMSSNRIFAAEYWRFLDRPYQTDLLQDQYLGGGIAWAMGEIPLILVMGAIFIQWFRSDRRESRRFDRAEASTEDRKLAEYNAYMSSLHEHERR